MVAGELLSFSPSSSTYTFPDTITFEEQVWGMRLFPSPLLLIWGQERHNENSQGRSAPLSVSSPFSWSD